MDAVYYTGKEIGTYYAGIGVSQLATGLGVAAGVVAIYGLGVLLDYCWSKLKKTLYE